MARRTVSARPTGTDRRKAVAWTKAWGDLKKRFEAAARGAHVKVGVLSSKGGASHVPTAAMIATAKRRHKAGRSDAGSNISLVELAAIHEFGSPAAGISERSFIRRTFDSKHAEIKSLATKLAERIVTGKMDLRRALEILGQFCAAEIKKTISNKEVQPQLDPTGPTARRKKSTTALVDTSQLKNSVTHEVSMIGGDR
jgi:hypothetical protein